MPDSNSRTQKTEIANRLQILMLLRVVLVSLLLGASIFIQIRETHSFIAEIQTIHYFIIISIYLLTFIYAILLKYSKNHHAQAYLQLIVDTVLVTVIIYTTGGIDSIFSFLYILTIINASMILYRRGGYVVASCSSILYGLLLDLHFYNIIAPLGARGTAPVDYRDINLFYLIVVNIGAFYLVAYLTGYLSEQTRRSRVELNEKQQDIVTLELLNKGIIDSITSGLIAVGPDERTILFNPAAEKIFAIRAEAAMDRKVSDVLPFLSPYSNPDSPGFFTRELSARPFTDLTHRLAGGQEINLRLSVAPLRLPRIESDGTIILFQDTTEITRIEAEMKRVRDLALIGELAAGIAHEIRNPMASISGSIQMLRDGLDVDDTNSKLMDIIMRETSRLNRLVNDFLIFARPRATKIKNFDLDQLITESLQLFLNSFKRKGKINIVSSLHSPPEISSDPEQIRQVLWNLLLNASEAMPEGGTLFVTTSGGDGKSTAGAAIEIRDTGPGFEPRALRNLFTPFFTTKEGGTGLGLATVRRVVENLGGTVEGGNHPTGGAVLVVALPRLEPGLVNAEKHRIT